MSRIPPFRQRPNLHLALTPLTGSPRQYSSSTPTSRSETPVPTPRGTPLATTSYSPWASNGHMPLRAHSFPDAHSYGTAMSYKPPSRELHLYSKHKWLHMRRLVSSRLIWLLLMGIALLLWWFNGGSQKLDVVKLSAAGLGKDFLEGMKMQEYQFYPASNPKIHYTGRWTSTPNRLRRDGTFPGVYFDITITNTTTFLVALHNHVEPLTDENETVTAASSPHPAGHLSFRPIPANDKPARPISLLARVDDDEYVLLPNASSLVTVCSSNLDKRRDHHIRIVAPMTDDGGRGVIELEGIWVSKGGTMKKVAGSLFNEDYADEDLLVAENDIVGERHRAGLSNVEKNGINAADRVTIEDEEEILQTNEGRKKILEVVTDTPGSFSSISRGRGRRTGGAHGLLSGVMGWEYLLGEMFGTDHVGIGVDGMCLTQDCIGGAGEPAGIGDVFFRSGPYGTEYFDHSWPFSSYVPDVLIFNVGDSDDLSFSNHLLDYNQTAWDLVERFEATYMSLVKGIRRLAYPKHPAILQSENSGYPGAIPPNTPAAIPIFILRPLRGQLEQATQNVVAKLRADGDKSVFWLDTSGWLDPDSNTDEHGQGDFSLDADSDPPRWRLTEQGNQRVAIFLHMHVCRYLAREGEKCAFLPHEVYQGKVFDPEADVFDRFIENDKERKLKSIFWAGDATTVETESPSPSAATKTTADNIAQSTSDIRS